MWTFVRVWHGFGSINKRNYKTKTMFNIFDYIIVKKIEGKDDRYAYVTTLYELINRWEEARCADGEALLDLENKDDFILLVQMYNIDIAIECYKTHRFCFAGYNYPTPKSVEDKYLEEFVRGEMTTEYFEERKTACGDEGFKMEWGDLVKVEEVEKEMEKDDNQLRFYLSTEVFYTHSHKFAVKVTDVETEWTETCVADTKDELAKKLMTTIEGYYEMLDDIAKNEEE